MPYIYYYRNISKIVPLSKEEKLMSFIEKIFIHKDHANGYIYNWLCYHEDYIQMKLASSSNSNDLIK